MMTVATKSTFSSSSMAVGRSVLSAWSSIAVCICTGSVRAQVHDRRREVSSITQEPGIKVLVLPES